MDKINYAKAVTNTSQIIYDEFCHIIESNINLLKKRKIVIFGAGIRGILISMIFEKKEIKDIVFTDNNSKLYSGKINQYEIFSLDNILEIKEDITIVVSPENSGEIMRQLVKMGFIENENLFDFGNKLYTWFIEEFKDKEKKDIFIIGDCGLMNFSILEDEKESLGNLLRNKLCNYKSKLLTMNSMGMRAFYNIIKLQLNMNIIPKYMFISIDLRNFNGKQHFLPESQNLNLIEKIYMDSKYKSEELADYLNVVKYRYEKSKINKAFVNKANNSNENAEFINKAYIKMNYMYNFKLENEEFVYFIKIMEELKKYNITPLFFILPINYKQGEAYFSNKFKELYAKNCEIVNNIIEKYGYRLMDMSFLLDSRYFLDKTTVEESISYEGRLKVRDEMIINFKNMIS